MRVITLGQDDFDSACNNLADKIIEDCQPAVIIGIRTGGAVVVEHMCTRFREKAISVKCLEVAASRQTTKVKREIKVAFIFRMLPFFILNFLRKIEHYCLKVMLRFRVKQERNVSLSDSVCNYLERLEQGCVYVVDDAIDSGETVKSVIGELNKVNSKLDYRVGVIVVTQSSSSIIPDVFLYRNVLVRFPWSDDYRI